jgi:hypothetical protein
MIVVDELVARSGDKLIVLTDASALAEARPCQYVSLLYTEWRYGMSTGADCAVGKTCQCRYPWLPRYLSRYYARTYLPYQTRVHTVVPTSVSTYVPRWLGPHLMSKLVGPARAALPILLLLVRINSSWRHQSEGTYHGKYPGSLAWVRNTMVHTGGYWDI